MNLVVRSERPGDVAAIRQVNVAAFGTDAEVGRALIAEGLGWLRRAEHPFCVVLGHAHYYPRHGFLLASSFGIRWERDVPNDVFFVRELVPDGLAGASGIVRYRPEFDNV